MTGGPGAGSGQAEEMDGGAGGGAGVGGEGALMKAVRVLGARLLGLSDPPKAPIGYGRCFALCALRVCVVLVDAGSFVLRFRVFLPRGRV